MNAELNNRFKYHDVDDGQIEKMEEIRKKFTELAELIDSLCPVSREKSLSLTNLEIASFYSNASISRYS